VQRARNFWRKSARSWTCGAHACESAWRANARRGNAEPARSKSHPPLRASASDGSWATTVTSEAPDLIW